MGLSPDGRSVTTWVPRESNAFKGITFTVDGNEPPIRLGLHPLAPSHQWALNFQNNRRTALVIKDDQIHRWSVMNPGVVGPGLPSPFRMMYREPATDGRSVISLEQGRVYDVGAWPPRPSGVRFAHPGWVNQVYDGGLVKDAESREKYSSDERFVATWAYLRSGVDRRLWRLPRPRSRTSLSPADFAPPPKQRNFYEFAQFDPHGETAVLYWHQEALETHDVPSGGCFNRSRTRYKRSPSRISSACCVHSRRPLLRHSQSRCNRPGLGRRHGPTGRTVPWSP